MRVKARIFWLPLLGFLLSLQPSVAGPALLFEPSNGKLLYAEDPDSQWYPASLTKIMTAYIAFQAIKERQAHPRSKDPLFAGCDVAAAEQGRFAGRRRTDGRKGLAGGHHQIGQRRDGHAGGSDLRQRNRVRRKNECDGASGSA